MMKYYITGVLTTFLALQLSFGQIQTQYWWDGGAGTQNWEDAANWNNNIVPSANTSVQINAGNVVKINSAAQVPYIILRGELEIMPNASLTLSTGQCNLYRFGSENGNAKLINRGTIYATGCSHGMRFRYGSFENYGTVTIENSSTSNLTNVFANIINEGMIHLDKSSPNALFLEAELTNNGEIIID